MEPSWIRSALAKIYPGADLYEGVDLDQNGTLEPWEEISDDNKNGEAGDRQDWEYFYYRNQQFLDFFDGPFQGVDYFKANNRIHDFMDIESEYVPMETIDRAYSKIYRLTLSEETLPNNYSSTALALIKAGIKLVSSAEHIFLSVNLDHNEITGADTFSLSNIFFQNSAPYEEGPEGLQEILLLRRLNIAEKKHEEDKLETLPRELSRVNPKEVSYLALKADREIRRNQFHEAKETLQQALRVNPEYPPAYVKMGFLLEKEGKYEEALKNYRRAEALGLSLEEIHMGKARVYKKLGKEDEAGIAYAKAALNNPFNPQANFELGQALLKTGYLENGILSISHAIEDDPDNIGYYQARGDAYFQIGKCKEAIADYTQVIDRSKGQLVKPQVFGNRAECYAKIGENEKALADNRRAGELGMSVMTQILELQGAMAAGQKNYPEAIRIFTILIEQDPKKSLHWTPRGVAKAQSGDYAGAIQDLDEAEKLGQTLLSDAFYARGLSHQFLGNFQQALRDFSRAIAAESGNAEYYHSRALTHHAMKEYRKAIAEYERTLQRNPNHPLARANKLRAIREMIIRR